MSVDAVGAENGREGQIARFCLLLLLLLMKKMTVGQHGREREEDIVLAL